LLLQRSQSIGRLFLAGIVPGLMIAAFFALTIYFWCAANPALGPKGEKSSWRQRLASLPELAWVLLVFVLIVGGLMQGFFTPTEAGSVGTFAVILLSVAQRGLSLRGFIKSLSEALRTACMVLMLIAGSTVLGHFLAVTKIPMIASEWKDSTHEGGGANPRPPAHLPAVTAAVPADQAGRRVSGRAALEAAASGPILDRICFSRTVV